AIAAISVAVATASVDTAPNTVTVDAAVTAGIIPFILYQLGRRVKRSGRQQYQGWGGGGDQGQTEIDVHRMGEHPQVVTDELPVARVRMVGEIPAADGTVRHHPHRCARVDVGDHLHARRGEIEADLSVRAVRDF